MGSGAAAILFRVGSAAWRVLRISITVPIIVIIAIAAWWQFDKSSAVRRAVDAKVKEMVAGADIAAAEAERDAARQMAEALAEQARRQAALAAAEAEARARFEAELAAAERINTELQVQIDAILSSPPPPGCLVDGALLERLR